MKIQFILPATLMKFFSQKYPHLFLGIFLCFTFFFTMPVSEVKADGDCKKEPFFIPEGKKFALILRNNGQIGMDIENKPSGQPCYVPVDTNATSVTYDELLNANVISANWQEISTMQVYLSCDENENHLHEDEWNPNPFELSELRMKLTKTDGCLVLERKPNANGQLNLLASYKHSNLKNKTTGYGINIGNDNQDQYLFFMGFQEADKDSQQKLVYCKDAMAIYTIKTEGADKGKNCDPAKYIPADKANDNDFFTKTGLSSMPLECKQVYENCMTGGTPEDPNKNDPRYGRPDGYEGPLPDCAFSYDGCRSINDILQFLVNIGQQVFKYIGTFAFVMFIYGGFTMILSMGSAEKVKKGQEILTAAVVGIIISFGAYLLIDFILDALQVGQDFRSIGSLGQGDEIPKK